MSTDALFPAIYVGPFPAELADGTKLTPGETEHQVTERELASGHWQRKKPAKTEKES